MPAGTGQFAGFDLLPVAESQSPADRARQDAISFLRLAPTGCSCNACAERRRTLRLPLDGSADYTVTGATPPMPPAPTPEPPFPPDMRWTTAPVTVSAEQLTNADALRGFDSGIRWADFAGPRVTNDPPVPLLTIEDDEPAEDLTPSEEGRAYIPRAVRADWRTPDNVLEVVRAALGGEVDLDPCASTTHWLAGGDEIGEELNFHEEDDGLSRDWGKRTVFVNPPFNRNRDWVAKCAAEAAKGAEVILLIPARTDTRYWQRVIAETAQAICFWRGRIRFVGATSGAPFPCAFVYWGPNAAQFDNAFDDHGQVLYTNNPVPTESENAASVD